MKKILFFLLAIIFAIQGYSQSIFVAANGTATNDYLPVYGYYMDDNQHSQFIYPASEVGALNGALISKIKFHTSSTSYNSDWGTATCTISIGVPTETSFASAAFNPTPLTQVYSGSIAVVNGIMEFTFTTPYLFPGGNMLIDITTITSGDYLTATFSGITATNGGYYLYSYGGGIQQFLPKATFEYTGGSPVVITSAPSSVNATSATLQGIYFNLTSTNYGFQYMLETVTDWSTASIVTATTNPMSEIVTSLTPNTSYKYRAFANDGTNVIYGDEKTFTTLALPATLPYACDFENPTENSEWRLINGTQTNKFFIGDASFNPAVNNTVGGSNALYISNDPLGAVWTYSGTGSATNSWVYAYRDFEVPAGVTDLKLDFDWIAKGGVPKSEFLRVYWMPTDIPITAGNLPPTVNSVNYDLTAQIGNYTNGYGEHWLSNQSTWQHSQFVINTTQFPTLAGTTWRLYVHWRNNQSAAVQPPATFDNMSLVISNCTMPRLDSVVNITQNAADIYFTENGTASAWNIEYRILGTNQWTPVVVTANPFNLPGLQPSTAYEIRLQSDCLSEQSAWTPIKKFNTTCGAITQIPWADYFDNYGTGTTVFPSCWTRKTNVSDRPYINSTSFSSPGSMYFYCGSAGNYNIASSPMIDATIPVNTLMLNFRVNFAGSDDTLYVGVMTDPNFDTTFTQVAKLYSGTTSTWLDKSVYLNFYQETGQYISFKTSFGASTSAIYIDNLNILSLPSCIPPSDVTAHNIQNNALNLNWVENGTSTSWEIEYGPVGFTHGTGITDVVSSLPPYTVSNLTSATTYDFYVRANCGGSYSAWTPVVTYTTACDPVSIPLIESFDNTTFPACWLNVGTVTSASGAFQIASSGVNPTCTPYAGANMLFYNSYSVGSGQYVALYSPLIALNGEALEVKFWQYKDPGYSSSLLEGITVYANSSQSLIGADSIGFSQRYSATAGWVQVTFNIPPGIIGNRSIIFKAYSQNGNNQYIDSISIALPPPCPDVQQFAINPMSTTSISTSWSNTLDDGTGYNISYGVAPLTLPFDPTTGTIVNIPTGTTLPYEVSGFNPGDSVWMSIQAGCIGNWSLPKLAVLPLSVESLPFSCNFEDTIQNSHWTIANGTQANKWYIGAPGANGGTGNGLYISNDNGTTVSYDINTASNVMASINIQFGNAQEFGLSFDWSALGESCCDYLNVYLVPLTYDITPGTIIPESYKINTTSLNNNSTWQSFFTFLGSQYSNSVKKLVFLWHNDGSLGPNPPGKIDNLIISAITCHSPNGFIVNNITTNTADLTWNNYPIGSEFIVEYKEAAATTWSQYSTMDTTYPMINLTANTQYNARIKAVCAPGDTSFASNISTFYTHCEAITTLPWSDFFDTYPTTNYFFPTCWTKNSNYENRPYVNTTYNFSAPAGMYFYAGSEGSYNIAATQMFDASIPINTLMAQFKYLSYNSTDTLYVGVMTDPMDISTFVLISKVTASSTYSWQDKEVNFNTYNGTGQYIAFMIRYNTTGAYAYIDNLIVDLLPSCPKPQFLNANTTDVTATMFWTETGSAQEWEVEWDTLNFVQGQGNFATSTDTFLLVNGLTAWTDYQFYVRAVCGVGDTSLWTGPYTFNTQSLSPVTYLESFMSGTVAPAGYMSSTWYLGSPTAVPGNPAYNIYVNLDDSSPASVTTTNIGPLQSNNILQFEYKLANYGSPYDPPAVNSGNFILAISTDWGATFTNIDTVFNNAVAGYQTYEIDLSAYNSDIVQFKITGNWNSGDYYLAVDNIYVGPVITCPYPSAFVASNPTTTSIDLAWTEQGSATQWQIEYGAPGFPQGTGTFVTANSHPFTVPSLTPSTTYDFYVRAICSPGDSSMWTNKVTATTACLPYTLPLTEGFEASTTIPGCWSTTTTAANYTVIATAGTYPTCTAHGGSNMLYYNSYGISTGNHAVLYSPLLNLTGASVIVSYWQYRDPGYSTYLLEGVEVFYNTTASLTGATSLGFTSRYFATAGWYNITYTIPAGLIGNAYVMFKTNSLYGNNQYIDDISIDYAVVACAVPTNLAVNGVTSSTGTATWTAGGSETQWEISYKPTASSTWITAMVSPLPTYPLPSLTAATPYDVKVRAICNVGDTSAYTAIFNFTTLATSCPAPTNLAATAITTTGATITWTAGGTETAWELDYKMASASTWTTVNTTAPSHIFTTLTPSTDYNVRVRAICGAGNNSDYTAVYNFTTATPPCLMPTNVLVPTATITDQSAVVNWTAAAGQTQWQVEYKLVSSANWTTMPISTATTQPIVALQSNSTYEVRVKALCSATNESPFTTPVQFTTTGAMVYTITASANSFGTISPSGSVVVNAGADQLFTFTPNTNCEVDSLVIDNATPIHYSLTTYTFPAVDANHSIYVKFKQLEGIAENDLAKLVELFPNPTNATIEIRMNETQLQVKECRVYDIYGKLMSIVPVNADNTKIDATDFAAGVYFIRMNSEMGVITKKFVKK
jgi:hypothetical protein